MPSAAQIQALYQRGLAKGAQYVGAPFVIKRPQQPLGDASLAPVVGNTVAQFSQNYNFNRAAKYDDVLWNALIDPRLVQVGDILIGNGLTYFVASMDPLLPVSCVRCTGTVDIFTQNSQLANNGETGAQPSQHNGDGHYWGADRDLVTDPTLSGETQLAVKVPCLMIANAGRATGDGQLPDDAPGPARWRFWLPASVVPKGSIVNRQVFVDDQGNRYYSSAAQWVSMGYRVETIRLEM